VLKVHLVDTMEEVLKIALTEPLPAFPTAAGAPGPAQVTESVADDTRPH